MSYERRLYGDDLTVSRTLQKIELAARRAGSHTVLELGGANLAEAFYKFADELAKIEKDLGK